MDDIGLEEIFFMFVVLIGVAIVFGIIFAVAKKSRDAENDACPIYESYAKVIDRQVPPPNYIPSLSELWVMFEVDDGSRRQLITKGTDIYVVGDEGMLVWQGKKVIRFSRGEKPQEESNTTVNSTLITSGNKACPKCNAVQRADRAVCLRCGAKFESDNSVR